jgi:hypothetical protein
MNTLEIFYIYSGIKNDKKIKDTSTMGFNKVQHDSNRDLP